MTRLTLTGAVILALTTSPAIADGWLESVAKQAAGQAIQDGAAQAVRGAFTGKKKPKAEAESDAKTEASGPPPAPVAQTAGVSSEDPFAEPGAPVPVAVAAPSAGAPGFQPINGGKAKRPGQLEFDPAVKARKEAFVEFSRYSCNDCEGGRGYDAWARQALDLGGGYNAFEKKIGSLKLGEQVTWKGQEADGSIKVVGEAPVGGFTCKQLKWELKKRKGGQSASRDGLLCLGKSSDYSASDSWVEVI